MVTRRNSALWLASIALGAGVCMTPAMGQNAPAPAAPPAAAPANPPATPAANPPAARPPEPSPATADAAPAQTAGSNPGFDLVSVTRDGAPAATGVVIGFSAASQGQGAQTTKRLVLVPSTALSDATGDQIRVRGSDGTMLSVELTAIDFQRLLTSASTISELARAGEISAALAREGISDAASQPPVTLLVVDEARPAQALRTVEVLDETCPEDSPARYFVSDGASAAERTAAQLAAEAGVGALSMTSCLGQSYVRGFVSSVRGNQIEMVDLSKLAFALKIWLKRNRPDAELMLRIAVPRHVSNCPLRSQRRSSARVAEREVDDQTGNLVLRVLDYPPDIDDPVSMVSERTESRMLDEEVPWVWGSRGDSSELFVLRVSGDSQGKFVFERFCKDNLAARGRITGQIPMEGASLSEDAATEGEDAHFAIRLSDKVTLVSTPTLRHGLIVDSFPEADRQSRPGRLHFAEGATGGDLLIAHSRSRNMLYVAALPAGGEGGEGGEVDQTGSRPALRMTSPRPLGWQNNAFDLAQLGWRASGASVAGGSGQGASAGASATARPRADAPLQVDVIGRSIAVAGDNGIAVLQLGGDDRPGILVNIDRLNPSSGTGAAAAVSAERRRFAEGNFRLVASTIAQAPGTDNFAIVAMYSEAANRAGQDLLAIVPVINGTPLGLRLLDMTTTVRDRVNAVAGMQNLGEDNLYKVEPVSGVLVLGTTPSLERFWGAVVVNAAGQVGRPGRPARDIDFALAFNLHFWFNPFDRIWDYEPVGTPEEAQSLCRFDFAALNVISLDNLPRRVIAPVQASCGGAADSDPRSAQTRAIAVRDFLFDRIRTPRAP